MGLEYELKYLKPNLDVLRTHLAEIGAERTAKPYFEQNLVFDYQDRCLRDKNILLRLRQKGEAEAVLTVKRPPGAKISSVLKVFEEYEVVVSDFAATQILFESLGYTVAFRYEKVREKWHLGGVDICLDTLPFGDFVELEGAEEKLFMVAKQAGLDGLQTSAASYHEFNLEHCQSKGLAFDESFLFSTKRRSEIKARLLAHNTRQP